MPLLLPCDELQPGMRLSEPVRRDGRVMLSAGRELSQTDIDALRQHCPDTLVRVGDPVLDSLVEFEDDGHEREVAASVSRHIAESMRDVEKKFSQRASLAGLRLGSLQAGIAEIIRFMKENPVSAALLEQTVSKQQYLAHHAGNVFYLSVLLGTIVRDYVVEERIRRSRAKGMSRKSMLDLGPLGMGTMLMDVGMLPLAYLFEEQRPLTPEEQQQLRDHPLRGARMLPEGVSPVARIVVQTHHENCDGSGYPAGLTTDRLHVFSRIVRIADAFDSGTAARVYRQAKSPARVLWEMTAGPNAGHYDPVLTRVLARIIQPFPIGSKLRLADGRYVVVVKYNRREPFKPYVIIAFDRDNRPLPQDKLDGPFGLHERPNLRLAEHGGENLTYIYDMPDTSGTLEPDRFAGLFNASYP